MKQHSSYALPKGYRNPLKVKLERGESIVGMVVSVNSVEIATQASALGFDFIWFEMEHSPVSLETVRSTVLATRGLPAVPIARPPVNGLWTAKRLLDSGVLGVIFPFTSTAELAKQAAAACRYPPRGKRGSGADLAQFRWPVPGGYQGYCDFADKNVLVITVLEDVSGLEQIEEIAATPEVDVIFIGTSDLSFSLGLRGEQNHPTLDAAVKKIVKTGLKHGKVMGRPGLTVEAIRKFEKQGFRFFMASTDTDFMAAGARRFLEPMGKQRAFAWGGTI